MTKKKLGLSVLLIFIFVTWPFSAYGENDMVGDFRGSSIKGYVTNHSLGQVSRLLLVKPIKKDAVSFAFRVAPYLGNTLPVERLDIPLKEVSGKIKNIRLVADLDSNGRYDKDDEFVGGEGILNTEEENPKIIFLLHFRISAPTDFILLINFYELEYGSRISFLLLLGKNFKLKDGKKMSGTATSIAHSFGNYNTPQLSWTGEKGWTKVGFKDKGVDPSVVISGDSVDFRVKYMDKDGHKPGKAEVWIDADEDGKYEQKLPMKKTSMVGFKNGVIYSLKSLKVYFKKKKKTIYRFYFTDGEKEAEGDPAKNNVFTVHPLVEFQLNAEPTQIISDEMIKIGGYIIWHHGTKTNFDSLVKTDFSPFKFKSFNLGEGGPYPGHYSLDRKKIDILLEPPSNLGYGKHEIKGLKILYEYKELIIDAEGKEKEITRTEMTESDPIVIEKIPILVISTIPAKSVVFGDEILIKYKLQFFKSLVFSKKIEEQFKKFGFLPFEIKENSVSIGKLKLDGNLGEIDVEYTLIASEPAIGSPEGLKIRLPKNSISYWLNEDDMDDIRRKNFYIIPSQEITIFPTLGEDEVSALFEANHNRIFDYEAITEGLDKRRPIILLSISGLFLLLMLFLFFNSLKRGSKSEKIIIDQRLESPGLIESIDNLKEELRVFDKENSDAIMKLFNAFALYAASMSGLSVAQAESILLFSDIKEKEFPKKELILKILAGFDDCIGSGEFDEQIIKKITSMV